jgi:peptidyl-prolyl cis-trans isomerase SurA
MKKILILLLFVPWIVQGQSHKQLLDKVVGKVGKYAILESEVKSQALQMKMQQGLTTGEHTLKCQILEKLLIDKLMLHQADLDSIVVGDEQVEAELDHRMRYFIQQFGSQEKFEEFYKKSTLEFKEEMRPQIRDMILIGQVQQTLTKDVKTTPTEVRKFYKSIPADSLPSINSEVEVAEIVKLPPINAKEIKRVRDQMAEYRERILSGSSSFKTIAVLYSEDPESAKKGGELGFFSRGEMYKEFEAAAFKLKEGEISDIIETKAGFHIIQMIKRKGDYVNVRHILLIPKPSPEDLLKAQQELDSIATLIEEGKIDFLEAVKKFSDAPNKNNGGLLLNPASNSSLFETSQLDPAVFFVIDKMEVKEISKPVPFKTEEHKDAYRLLYLKRRTEPHRANLKDDYDKIQQWSLESKKSEAIHNWILDSLGETYINVDSSYQDCNFKYNWGKNNK